MAALKLLLLIVSLVGVSCRSVDQDHLPGDLRIRRQIGGKLNTNPDGSVNIMGKLPLARGDHNELSAIGALGGLKQGGGVGSVGGGLTLQNERGHSLTGMGTHIPGFGDQLTGAANLNLLNSGNHKVDANAFATHNMPSIPNFPNHNTYGGSLGYMYKDKIGGSLGMSHTDLFKKTDYSAMGNLNLYRDRASSLDFNGGFSKSISPYIPNSSWQPSAGLSYTKYWG